MKRIINITLLELTKLLKKREFLLGLIMVLVMGAGMTYGAYAFPDSFGVHNVIAFFGNFSSILIMFLAAKSLGEEFEQQEYFSVKEIAEMLETSEEEVRQQIAQLQEQNGAKPIETMQGWQWYFPNGIK